MSRLAKKPILISKEVTVKQEGDFLFFKGPKGEKKLNILPFLKINLTEGSVSVNLEKNVKQGRANIGTMWSLIKNAADGVLKEFSKTLEIEGVGFRAALDKDFLVLSLGFSHPVKFKIPDGIKISLEKNTINISGVDKEKVGQVAAEIRSLKKPEPYKGKGIHYQGEFIRRKAGKKAVSST